MMQVRIAIGTLLVGLAGCAGMPQLQDVYLSDSYRFQMLNYAAASGGMLTEITGNPFDVDKAELDQVVTETFTNSHFGPEFGFFTEAPEDYRSPYRTVVLFNAAEGVNAKRLCGGGDREQSSTPGSIRLIAVFCSSDRRISSATGVLGGASGPEDPTFKRLLSQVSYQLFPPYSPVRSDRDFEAD